MPESAISYAPRPDATAEAEVAALSHIYKLLLDRHAHKNAAGVPSTNGDNARKESNHARANTNST